MRWRWHGRLLIRWRSGAVRPAGITEAIRPTDWEWCCLQGKTMHRASSGVWDALHSKHGSVFIETVGCWPARSVSWAPAWQELHTTIAGPGGVRLGCSKPSQWQQLLHLPHAGYSNVLAIAWHNLWLQRECQGHRLWLCGLPGPRYPTLCCAPLALPCLVR